VKVDRARAFDRSAKDSIPVTLGLFPELAQSTSQTTRSQQSRALGLNVSHQRRSPSMFARRRPSRKATITCGTRCRNRYRASPDGTTRATGASKCWRPAIRYARRSATRTLSRLSVRERQVLQLIAEGNSVVDIAGKLSLSRKTVETYRERMMEKLGLHDFAGLIKFAIQHHVISLD